MQERLKTTLYAFTRNCYDAMPKYHIDIIDKKFQISFTFSCCSAKSVTLAQLISSYLKRVFQVLIEMHRPIKKLHSIFGIGHSIIPRLRFLQLFLSNWLSLPVLNQ